MPLGTREGEAAEGRSGALAGVQERTWGPWAGSGARTGETCVAGRRSPSGLQDVTDTRCPAPTSLEAGHGGRSFLWVQQERVAGLSWGAAGQGLVHAFLPVGERRDLGGIRAEGWDPAAARGGRTRARNGMAADDSDGLEVRLTNQHGVRPEPKISITCLLNAGRARRAGYGPATSPMPHSACGQQPTVLLPHDPTQGLLVPKNDFSFLQYPKRPVTSSCRN